MLPEHCPNPEELRKFVRCSVTEEQADSIADHLEVCPTCEETVVGLERDGDTVAEHIRKAVAEPTFAHEPECQQIIQSMLEGAAIRSTETSPTESELPVAHNLRDYQIIAKLGEGGMGTVYKAIHQRLKKKVALKVLPTNRIGDQPAVARFEREMSVLGQLNHPHIVQALDAGEHDGQHYLVMEYVEGCDLSDIVKRCSPLSIADACLLISQAAEGLQYAHEHGFVHRDIKPSNLMLARTANKSGASAVVKILDLGLARALDQRPDVATPNVELTTTGQVMGTLDYMAPEQGDDSHQVDIRADIYSLGVTLYKLLTGKSPFAEFASLPPMRRLIAIAQHEPAPIGTKRAGIAKKLGAIVHRMIAKRPEQRFATPAEVVAALASFCTGADLTALSNAAEKGSPSEPSPTPELPARTSRFTSSQRRFAVVGIAALVTISMITVIAVHNGNWYEVGEQSGAQPTSTRSADWRPVIFKNPLGMRFALIPKGSGRLGGSDGKPGDTLVEISDDFYLGICEVTQGEWQSLMGRNPSYHSAHGESRESYKDVSEAELQQFPVENVSWHDVQEFLKRLNERDNQAGWKYRLPKAAEWEYACRNAFLEEQVDRCANYFFDHGANQLLPGQANFAHSTNPKRACKTGAYPPNRLGLHDMHGNVFEWCDDLANSEHGAPERVTRGGSWFWTDTRCHKASFRATSDPSSSSFDLGFRIARVPTKSQPVESVTP